MPKKKAPGAAECAAPTARKQRGRPFQPGQSGNPAGRAKGSRNKVTLLVEAMLEDDAEALTRALIKKAKAGSTHAMELVFARIAPVRRDRQVEIALPSLDTLADLVAAHGKVLEAVASGELSPAEAREIAGLIDLRRRAVESVELLQRIEALEQHLTDGRHATH